MRTHKNSHSQPDVAESHLKDQSLVKKWRIADPNIIFEKKSEACLITAKVQIQPGSSEIGRSLRKIQNIPPKVSQRNESWYMYPRWSIIYVGWSSQLSISRFGSRFIKKTQFWHSENRKGTFHERKQKSVSVGFLAIPMATRVSDMSHSDKLCHDRGQT
jgi:hypothetical protein